MIIKSLIPRAEARRLVLERRKDFSDVEIKRKTEKIIERLKQLDDFVLADTIHCYISSRPGEVDTHGLINLMDSWGKSIVIPKLNTISNTFIRGSFSGWNNLQINEEGYLEPKIGINDTLDDVDLFIIPSVALTTFGKRIGYGKRYYEKLLKNKFVPKITIAFEFQLFDDFETTRDDLIVDKIVTELRVINTRKSPL